MIVVSERELRRRALLVPSHLLVLVGVVLWLLCVVLRLMGLLWDLCAQRLMVLGVKFLPGDLWFLAAGSRGVIQGSYAVWVLLLLRFGRLFLFRLILLGLLSKQWLQKTIRE